MKKPCILKDEYESQEWDNFTLEGEERAFPLGAGDETLKSKNLKLQFSWRALWLRIAFIGLTNWFLQMPSFVNQIYCLAGNLKEATHLTKMPERNFHYVYTGGREHRRGLPAR